MVKKDLILIKLGGSLITDKNKPFTARKDVILRLGKEIKFALRKLKNTDLIIGHGSGSFGHSVASKYKTAEGLSGFRLKRPPLRQGYEGQAGLTRQDLYKIKGFPLVADAAVQINRIVVKELLGVSLPVVSFAPLSFSFNAVSAFQFIRPITRALEIGLIPVVYGDVVMDKKQGFCIFSGEKTLNLVASHLIGKYQNIRIIEAGDTDGVYDKNGKTIPVITPKSYPKIAKAIKESGSVDVTGGMLHKVKEAVELAKKCGVQTIIINGFKTGSVRKALTSELVLATLVRN